MTAADQTDPLIGIVVHGFRVEKKLGEGGMGKAPDGHWRHGIVTAAAGVLCELVRPPAEICSSDADRRGQPLRGRSGGGGGTLGAHEQGARKMITAFMAANELHAIHVILQKGMTTIQARSLCSTAEENAGPGVYQVPDWAFDGRPKYVEIPVCAKCAGLVARLKEPPPR